MAKGRVLITGAAGYVAGQMLGTLRERYETVLLDVTGRNRRGDEVRGVQIADLIDPDRGGYEKHFEGVDAVVHLGYRRRGGSLVDHFFDEKQNVDMAYNVLRAAYDAGVPRVVMASSNHAADWYEHALIHRREKEMLGPYEMPLSDNFYGWAKAAYEHMGFLFACGGFGRKMGTVMVRIGGPRETDVSRFRDDPAWYKRELGAYLSARDLTQLFVKAIETPNIENEHGIPWLVVYGISNNTRAFWSLTSARGVLGYEPEDDSEVRFADDIRGFLTGEGAEAGPGRVAPSPKAAPS